MPRCEVRLLKAAHNRRAPWKNGRGMSEEIALWPAGSSFERGDFDWRIAKAQVDAPGAFSSFPGFERVLLILGGSSMVLEHGELSPRAHLRPLEPARFSGDWPTRCELPGGAVCDLNVLTRRGVWQAEVLALQLGQRRMRESLESVQACVHVVGGGFNLRVSGEETPFELEVGDSLLISEGARGVELDIQGLAKESTLVLVHLNPARPN